VDEAGASPRNFVGADGCPHATAAERNSAINCAGSNGPGQRDNVIRVIISGAQVLRAEVCDLETRPVQEPSYLLLQRKAAVVLCNSYAHYAFSFSRWSTL
jgi:hypothetical protein